MDPRTTLPGWLVPAPASVRDLSCLALRLVVEQQLRQAAGMVAAAGWLHGSLRGPVTGRPDGPASRDVVLCELCTAESLVDDGHATPPVREVHRTLGVEFWPAQQVDAGYARGVWLTLRWALGVASRGPLDLPIRDAAGHLVDDATIYAGLLSQLGPASDGVRREQARRDAAALVEQSRRLAELVEDTAERIRS
jgi:hypothetical protein